MKRTLESCNAGRDRRRGLQWVDDDEEGWMSSNAKQAWGVGFAAPRSVKSQNPVQMHVKRSWLQRSGPMVREGLTVLSRPEVVRHHEFDELQSKGHVQGPGMRLVIEHQAARRPQDFREDVQALPQPLPVCCGAASTENHSRRLTWAL